MKNDIQINSGNLLHNITYIRNHLGIPKKKMAELLGISVNSLSKIENGLMPQRLSVEIIYNIEHNFRISPYELFNKKF